jgi:DNA repair exonuclease SbcCD nuclease subunit
VPSRKIVFWGDPQIGKMCGGKFLGAELGLRYHRRLNQRLLKATRDIGAQHVVVLGDIFETPFPTQDEQMLALKTFSAPDLRFLIYPGNHDIHDAEQNSLKLFRALPEIGALTNVTFIVQPNVVKFAGMQIGVMPFGCKKVPPGADLYVIHGNIVGAKRDNNTPVKVGEGLDPSAFGGKLVISGHIHTPQKFGSIVYAGTGAQLSFGEDENKRICWLDDGRLFSRPFDPPWKLRTVDWSSKQPPKCDEPDVFYKLRVANERPPNTWLARHPQVLDIDVGKSKKSVAKEQIVRLMNRTDEEDDIKTFQRYLIEHTNLDKLGRLQALKEHRKLTGEG